MFFFIITIIYIPNSVERLGITIKKKIKEYVQLFIFSIVLVVYEQIQKQKTILSFSDSSSAG